MAIVSHLPKTGSLFVQHQHPLRILPTYALDLPLQSLAFLELFNDQRVALYAIPVKAEEQLQLILLDRTCVLARQPIPEDNAT